MRLAGECQRHHGAAVERVFEGDDAGTFSIGARNLHRVLDGFGAAVHEDGLLRELSWRDFVHALGEANVALVRRDLHASVQEAVELVLHGFNNSFLAMADVQTADASGKVEVAVAVHVLEPGVFGLGNVDGRAVRKAAGHGFGAALGKGLGFRPWDGGAKLNCGHLSSQFSVLSFWRPALGFRLPGPQRLKPRYPCDSNGTTKVVPFHVSFSTNRLAIRSG